MRAIILAGGLGTRLKAIIGDDIPKCLALINGKPFIDIQIEELRAQNITDITLCVGHLYHQVVAHLGTSVKYSTEDKPLGTGGAIKKCVYGTEPILILNGDTLAKIDYNDMLTKHQEWLTIAVSENGESAGIYIADPEIFSDIEKESFSFERDLIPHMPHDYYHIESFIDIGTAEGYAKAQRDWV